VSLGHIISEGTTGQNSSGIDKLDIVVWCLAMQKLIDVVAMTKRISGWRDMTSQTRTLNKFSKSSSMPNHEVRFYGIFRMRMTCPSNKVFKVADMSWCARNDWACELVGLYNRTNGVRLNKQSKWRKVLGFRGRNRELILGLGVGRVRVKPNFGIREWARADSISTETRIDVHECGVRLGGGCRLGFRGLGFRV
jgi:hypothetical protein